MDSVVKDEKKHDQRLEETMKIFEDGGDQRFQTTIKIKKRPPRCHDDDDDDDDEGGVFRRKRSRGDQCLQKTIKIKKRPPRCHDDDDDDDDDGGCVQEKKKLRMKKMMDKARCPSPHATPELSVILRNQIRALGGSDITFVIQKPIFKTDVSPGHNRLSIPLNQIQQSFLTPKESERLNSGGNGKKCADMEVMLIEPSLHRETISLSKWNMKKASKNSTSMYVLVTNWKSVTEMNSMKEDETVQLWSFRIKSKLGFALVKRRLQDDPRNRSLRGIMDS
ncbi:putative B3 domain-containing protein At3g24850 [Vitis riparia]|uniref:putative B3 domain-containing protein At3g24850 n=1 Tax=Vitis riparia TaxID=96939 RepID=UPI00155A8E8D|nr:putative B3 domain-containing protein At3g24850 [Vitis riparia]